MPGILEQIKALRAAEEDARSTESVANHLPSSGVASVARKSLPRSSAIPARSEVIGTPHTRLRGHTDRGDPLNSRPFAYKNFFAMISGARTPDQCRTEIEVCDEFTKSMQAHYPDWSPMPGHILVPLSLSLLPEPVQDAIKSLGFVNGDNSYDPDEIAYARQQVGHRSPMKSMGSLDYSRGAALIPNPAYGDIIRLARNTPGLFEAGCQTFPIPPQGAIEFPRITSATEVAAIDGEGDDTPETELGTDTMVLQAKMISGIVTLSNKLLMMSMPAAETIVQEDLILSTLLQMDYFGFFGRGGIEPTGIVNQLGVKKLVASVQANTGDTIQPQDWFNLFWTACAQANRQFTGWVMNPRTYASNTTARADAVSANDKAGLFVNSPFAPLGRALESWFNHKVTWTNQIPVTRTKTVGGSVTGTGLTCAFGGPWNEAVVGLFGGVQVLMNPYETDAYKKQQTKVRVTALGDFGLRYPQAFSWVDFLTN